MRRVAVISMILAAGVAPAGRAVEFAGGTGEPNDPYQVATAEQLIGIGPDPNLFNRHFVLVSDINLGNSEGADFHTIGYWRSEKDSLPFTGVFDGGGHCLSNFQRTCLDQSYMGLFGYVAGPDAEVRNLTLVDARMRVRGGNNIACLVGYLRGGSLTACSTKDCDVVVQAGNNVGSLVGWLQEGTLSDCSTSDVFVQVAQGAAIGSMAGGVQRGKLERCRAEGAMVWSVDGSDVGGLVGRLDGDTLTGCRATADVAGGTGVGGLVGGSRGTIADCSAGGSVLGNADVGGLAGKSIPSGSRGGGPTMANTITRCFANADVVGTGSVGGLLGSNPGAAIESCYATGPVTGVNSVGGLVGWNFAAIANCYATGPVTGGSSGCVGGLVGRNGRTITNCYSAGAVSNGWDAHGLVGCCDDPEDVVACFWDVQTSGHTKSEGGLGKTTIQMHTASTFLVWAVGGNEGAWKIDDGVDYPRLSWETRPGELIRLTPLAGAGTADDPYLIHTAAEFNRVGAMVQDLDKCFKLVADIDLADYNDATFNLVGSETNPFRGVFDGNGHSIANFNYVAHGVEDVGLFGVVSDPNARIMNLRLVDPNVSVQAGTGTGGLVGLLVEGTVANCHVEGGRISGGNWVGGLVGSSGTGILADCSASTTVSGYFSVGGLTGGTDGDVIRCRCDCSVSGSRTVGGLVGGNGGSIRNCYAGGSVSSSIGTTGESIGGLVGNNSGTVTDSYATGNSSGGASVGGLVGNNTNDAMIRNCHCVGEVMGETDTGGLVGRNAGVVSGCFWDIEKTRQASSAGGTGMTSRQMQMAEMFLLWGACGHAGVWTMDDGSGYPRLSWEGTPGQAIEAAELSDLLDGTGSLDDPYLIHTPDELNLIGSFPCDWGKHFALAADLDLSTLGETPFEPIGSEQTPFTGVFDGRGHTIAGLVLSRMKLQEPRSPVGASYAWIEEHNIGLFGYVEGLDAVIKDLALIAPVVEAEVGGSVGTLVGALRLGIVLRCHCRGGSVTGGVSVGGLIGGNSYGRIEHCSATCAVIGSGRVGGLVGAQDGVISRCAAGGEVSGEERVGGLAGSSRMGSIRDSHATGDVHGVEAVGGLVGSSSTIIATCFSSGSVQGMLDVGGLVGINEDRVVSDCYATGSVTWTKPLSKVLWVLYGNADMPAEIAVGGLVGRNGSPDSEWADAEIVRCYCIGRVSGHVQARGLVGRQQANSTTLASFWDLDATGQNLSAGGEGKSAAEMQDPDTFLAAGWDFLGAADGPDDVWTLPADGGYPILASQLPAGAGLPAFSGGSGEPDDPYLISTADQLNSLGCNPRLMDAHFLLVNDIDVAGVEFFCIGSEIFPFVGVFDGGGHTISNFGRVAGKPTDIGFFGYVSGDKTGIRNVGLINPNLHSPSANTVGVLVGSLGEAAIADCFVAGGRVEGERYVGGLVGYIWYGGIVTRCWSGTDVAAEGYGYAGGLVGYVDWGTVANSCSRSVVTATWFAGGLAGLNGSIIVDCYAEGSVGGSGCAGGLVGLNENGGRVTSSYATAAVMGQETSGGLVGGTQVRQVLQSFWDTQTSGQLTSAGGVGKTTAEMQTAAMFTDAGWDFENVWTICEGRDYPRLRWEGVECDDGF